ncbi:MAG: hypothetical protein ABH829_04030 [archaeon]
MESGRGYFSLFSAIGIVLMAYFLFSVYSLHTSILSEGRSTSILLDRLYTSRKGAETLFWEAALVKDSNDEKMLSWEAALENDQISTAAWVGDAINSSALSCNLSAMQLQHGGTDLSDRVDDSPNKTYEFVDCLAPPLSGQEDSIQVHPCNVSGIPAFAAVICFKSPEAATYFAANSGDLKSIPTT